MIGMIDKPIMNILFNEQPVNEQPVNEQPVSEHPRQ